MHAIEAELQKVTKVMPKSGAARDSYLRDIIAAVQDLTDQQWGSLSTEAQHWVNSGTRALKAKKSIADFPSDDPPKKVDGVPQKSDDKPVGAQTVIKRMLIKEPGLTVDDLCGRLEKQGYKTSRLAVSTMRSDFRHSLKILKEEGKLKGIEL